jgi:predicted HicB family RNase H-like nuclease
MRIKNMEYKGYQAKITFDKNRDLFVGQVANIKQTVKFRGYTVGQLKNSFRESVDEYISMKPEQLELFRDTANEN